MSEFNRSVGEMIIKNTEPVKTVENGRTEIEKKAMRLPFVGKGGIIGENNLTCIGSYSPQPRQRETMVVRDPVIVM